MLKFFKNLPQKTKSSGNLLKRAQEKFERVLTTFCFLRAKLDAARAKAVNHELKFVI
jgi:hypothetical protein